ncbi:MAG: hypothetical protein MR945_03465, partial [Agathobacter sp.]|nr:hypothetical protein [Agathobacter sp.]
MNEKKMSLTWRLIITMVGIVAGTVVLCWFLNNTFLEKYYIYKKEQGILSSFYRVSQICNND